MSLIIGPLGNPSPCIINRALLAYFKKYTSKKIDRNSYLSQREKSVFVLWGSSRPEFKEFEFPVRVWIRLENACDLTAFGDY